MSTTPMNVKKRCKKKYGNNSTTNCYGDYTNTSKVDHIDNGGLASRYFKRIKPLVYQSKASKGDRNKGLINATNKHPTVKPTELMKYLVTLVTPHDGIALDPYMGSGSTGVACMMSDKMSIGIEMDEEYFDVASERITNVRINK